MFSVDDLREALHRSLEVLNQEFVSISRTQPLLRSSVHTSRPDQTRTTIIMRVAALLTILAGALMTNALSVPGDFEAGVSRPEGPLLKRGCKWCRTCTFGCIYGGSGPRLRFDL
ncbi:hypothetical protein BST61_g2975 [Cercospora zeina]